MSLLSLTWPKFDPIFEAAHKDSASYKFSGGKVSNRTNFWQCKQKCTQDILKWLVMISNIHAPLHVIWDYGPKKLLMTCWLYNLGPSVKADAKVTMNLVLLLGGHDKKVRLVGIEDKHVFSHVLWNILVAIYCFLQHYRIIVTDSISWIIRIETNAPTCFAIPSEYHFPMLLIRWMFPMIMHTASVRSFV